MKYKAFQVTINGDRWGVFLFGAHDFEACAGKGVEAVTFPEKRNLVFRVDEVNKPTVIHEVVHAYATYLCMGSARLKSEQVEEMFCDLLGSKLTEITKTSNEIYSRLRKLRHSLGVA